MWILACRWRRKTNGTKCPRAALTLASGVYAERNCHFEFRWRTVWKRRVLLRFVVLVNCAEYWPCSPFVSHDGWSAGVPRLKSFILPLAAFPLDSEGGGHG